MFRWSNRTARALDRQSMTPDVAKDAGTISAGSAPYLLRHHQGARLGWDTPISSINCHRSPDQPQSLDLRQDSRHTAAEVGPGSQRTISWYPHHQEPLIDMDPLVPRPLFAVGLPKFPLSSVVQLSYCTWASRVPVSVRNHLVHFVCQGILAPQRRYQAPRQHPDSPTSTETGLIPRNCAVRHVPLPWLLTVGICRIRTPRPQGSCPRYRVMNRASQCVQLTFYYGPAVRSCRRTEEPHDEFAASQTLAI